MPLQEIYSCRTSDRSDIHAIANNESADTESKDSVHSDAHRSTCSVRTRVKLSKSVRKPLRGIQINPVQDERILTVAHTVHWPLKIPNQSSREDGQMNGRLIHHERRTRGHKVGLCWKHRRRGTRGGSGLASEPQVVSGYFLHASSHLLLKISLCRSMLQYWILLPLS